MIKNLFTPLSQPTPKDREVIETLIHTGSFRLERIVSSGQATPPGEWFDQDGDEWVALLSGSAGLLFEGEDRARILHSGDYLLIPARVRHRVEWTEQGAETVWLALHFTSPSAKPASKP